MKRLLALLAFAALFSASPAQAQTVHLLTQSNQLLTFDSANPGGAGAPVAITGLGGFDLVGIDVRTTVQTIAPANPGVGSLWALGVNGANTQLFVINPATAAATPVGPVLAGIDGSLSGENGWFFGHNPGSDRFRLINSANNYELNPNTMTFVQQADLTGFPNLNGSAFETASFGENPRIYFVEQGATDNLHTSTNIASGNHTVVGDTGVDFTLGSGLDILGGQMLLAAPVGGFARLYSINRSTGLATLIGDLNGNPSIRGISIQPISFPGRLPVVLRVQGKKKLVTSAPSVRIRGKARSRAGIKRVEYRVGKAKPKRAKGTTRWRARVKLSPGVNKIRFRAIGGNDVRSKTQRVRAVRL